MVTDFIVQTKAAIAQLTDQEMSVSASDLTNCDREPIHIPAQIQPHGVMLVLNSDRMIEQVSQNSEEVLAQSPQSLLGKPLSVLLSAVQMEQVQQCLDEDFEAANPLRFELDVGKQARSFAAVVHRSESNIILELELSAAAAVSFFDFHRMLKRPVERLRQTTTIPEFCAVAVQEVHKITGYDRVMVYQFDADDSGRVVAEVKPEGTTPYLGLHYPASDIPKQAKHLYTLNLLRLIPDVTYEPVPLLAADTAKLPVDMSFSTLRSVSPLHTEYLANMGVRATLAISLVHNQRLWGLIVCHHNSPRHISYELRTVCEFFGQIMALELSSKVENEDSDYKLRLKALQSEFVVALQQGESLRAGLVQSPDHLLGLTGAGGAAYCEKGEIVRVGDAPTTEQIEPLLDWLQGQMGEESLYDTVSLGEVYKPAGEFAAQASGLLALAISKVQQIYVLWFRPEVPQTVSWAGNPDKPVEIDPTGVVRLSPRRSFEQWQQRLEGHSLPWKPCEVEAALELRSSVISLVLQRADELAQLNTELTRSNVELDAFAYIASHDLKEPLRGIYNYSSFLIEDYADQLGDDGSEKLHTLMRLTQRMEDLINSLLHYSRLGRAELRMGPVDTKTLANSVVEMIEMSKPGEASFEIAEALPVVMGDRTQLAELLTNLVSNGIKYNRNDSKQIELGALSVAEAVKQEIFPEDISSDTMPADLPILYVRDNGIGIKPKHIETVFRIFKRLHSVKRYGGGTGVGLTIARKIVERHSGRIWVRSTEGRGSTFYFTLEAAEGATGHE